MALFSAEISTTVGMRVAQGTFAPEDSTTVGTKGEPERWLVADCTTVGTRVAQGTFAPEDSTTVGTKGEPEKWLVAGNIPASIKVQPANSALAAFTSQPLSAASA